MAILSVLPVNYSAFLHHSTHLQSKFPGRVNYCRDVSLTPTMISRTKIKQRCPSYVQTKFVTSATSNGQHLSYDDDDLPQVPFLLSLIRETLWGIKSSFVFLVEQPSQLKYIEWPSFSSTLRTASLTLVLVALLIVALASVDSALCYLLALVLRKSP